MSDHSILAQGGAIASILAVVGGVLLAFVKMIQKNGCLFTSWCFHCDCNEGRARTRVREEQPNQQMDAEST